MKSLGLYFILSILAILSGCKENSINVIDETEEPHYRRGQSLLRDGRDKDALEAFLKVIDKRKDAAESHVEAGRIHMDHFNDSINAIYHFQKYLEIKPDSRQAELLKQLIRTAQKKYVKSLPGYFFESKADQASIDETVMKLKAENEKLKIQLVTIKDKLKKKALDYNRLKNKIESAASRKAKNKDKKKPDSQSDSTVESNTETPPFYFVVTGDTLSKISSKVYGTTSRWREIFKANSDQLENPHDLKIGQKLKIP